MFGPSVPASQAAAGYGPMGSVYADAFVPRYRVTAALVIAKDRSGLLRHWYKGELLDYLNDEQREHFLRMKLVEKITEADLAQSASPAPAQQPGASAIAAFDVDPGVNAEVATECVRDLDRLNVLRDAGAPTARAALRDAGLRYANDVIRAAVKARKEHLAAVPDS